jgi:hypothetical protein
MSPQEAARGEPDRRVDRRARNWRRATLPLRRLAVLVGRVAAADAARVGRGAPARAGRVAARALSAPSGGGGRGAAHRVQGVAHEREADPRLSLARFLSLARSESGHPRRVEVTADGETYRANLVKIAVNVMTRGASDENVLPSPMRERFGPNARLPGTTFQVVFEQSADGYTLWSVSEKHERQLTLWERYPRAEVPKFFGFELKGFEAQEGHCHSARLDWPVCPARQHREARGAPVRGRVRLTRRVPLVESEPHGAR